MVKKLPSSLLTFLAGCFIQACTLLQGIIVARLLGPEGRGEFAAATLPALFLGGVGLAGVNLVLTRLAAKIPNDHSLRRSALVLGLFTSGVNVLIGLVLCYAFLPSQQQHLLPLARFYLLMIPLQHLSLNFLGVLQGEGDFHTFNVSRSLFNVSYVIALLVLAVLHVQNLWFFLLSLLLANSAVVIWQLVGLFRNTDLFGPLHPTRGILKETLPYAGFVLTDQVYQWLDKVLLLWLLGSTDLGLYMVAMSAAGATSVLTTSMGVIAFTQAAREDAGGGFEKVAGSFRLAVLLSVTVGIGFIACLPWLLPLVFGAEFGPAVLPASVLVVASAMTGLSGLLGQSLQGQGRPLLCTYARAAFVPAFVLIGWLGARSAGLVGVAAAFAVAQTVVLALHLVFVMQHYGQSGIRHFVPKGSDLRLLFAWARKLTSQFPGRKEGRA